MIGGVIGDMIGYPYEFRNRKIKNFELFTKDTRFTDDSVLTIATADVLLNKISYDEAYRKWYKKYPYAGYGNSFKQWAVGKIEAFDSYGNGCAMRVIPIGWMYNNIDDVLAEAEKSAIVTHTHSEGIKGAQAIASAVFLARIGKSKNEIKECIENRFGYNLDKSIDEIRPDYKYDASCQGTVPIAIMCFLQSNSYEDAIRNCISLSGDCDTTTCMAGGIAEAFYKEIPDFILDEATKRLPKDMLDIISEFKSRV